jgi:hypothetical protein
MPRLSLADLAHALFASPLQELDRPTAAQVRAAVRRVLWRCGGDCSICVGCVAQEAGDHPHEYQRRMRWALEAVRQAYHPALPLAS